MHKVSTFEAYQARDSVNQIFLFNFVLINSICKLTGSIQMHWRFKTYMHIELAFLMQHLATFFPEILLFITKNLMVE